jgi:hypothetical protein
MDPDNIEVHRQHLAGLEDKLLQGSMNHATEVATNQVRVLLAMHRLDADSEDVKLTAGLATKTTTTITARAKTATAGSRNWQTWGLALATCWSGTAWSLTTTFAIALQLLQNNVIVLCIRACWCPVSKLWPAEAMLLNLHALDAYCEQQTAIAY